MDQKNQALTAPQAEALADLLHQLRPEWAKPAIMAALREHYRHPAGFNIVAQAAVTAANNPANQAPCSIFFDGPHWPQTARPTRIMDPCLAHKTEDRRTCRCCIADVKAGQRPRDQVGNLWPMDAAA